jgi:hypothetical protein
MASIPLVAVLWHRTVIQLFITAIIEGTGFVFFNLAEVACLPRVIPTEQLPSASAQNEIAMSGANLIAPALGGFIYQTLGRTIPFLADAVFYSASVLSLLFPLYSLAPNPLLLGVIFAAAAVTIPIYNAVQFSYRLALIPDQLQGRVNSVFRLLAFGLQPIGMVVAGALLQTIGPVTTVLVFSGSMLTLAFLPMANRHIRNARPLIA